MAVEGWWRTWVMLGLALWASGGPALGSWLGEVPTAAQMFGEEAVESVKVVPFEDEENDEDEDADLVVAAASQAPATEPPPRGRRRKRDADDELLLRRRAANRKSASGSGRGDELEDGAEGDEDAWVHDGVDDIQIDPETRRAASDLSGEQADEKSIDAEYEQQPQQVNRTRITTIAEVIPITAGPGLGPEEDEEAGPAAAASTGAGKPAGGQQEEEEEEGYAERDDGSLPAAYLSLDQVVRLVGEQQARAAEAAGRGRPLAATSQLSGRAGRRQVRLSVVDGASSGADSGR